MKLRFVVSRFAMPCLTFPCHCYAMLGLHVSSHVFTVTYFLASLTTHISLPRSNPKYSLWSSTSSSISVAAANHSASVWKYRKWKGVFLCLEDGGPHATQASTTCRFLPGFHGDYNCVALGFLILPSLGLAWVHVYKDDKEWITLDGDGHSICIGTSLGGSCRWLYTPMAIILFGVAGRYSHNQGCNLK